MSSGSTSNLMTLALSAAALAVDNSPVARTEAAIKGKWADDPGRQNKGRAFIKRAKKSDKRHKIEKASRKRNRR